MTELEPDADNPEPWLVEWTWRIRRHPEDERQRHDSKAAAQQHVRNMLKELEPGLTKDGVLTVITRGEPGPPPTM